MPSRSDTWTDWYDAHALLLPSVDAAGRAYLRYDTRLQMTRAALLYLDGGREAFETVKQPGTDKPFALGMKGMSATITADLKDRDDKPIAITIRTIKSAGE